MAGVLATLTKIAVPAAPFLLGLLQFIVGILGIAVIVFPNVVPFKVSIWDAASSDMSQKVVLIAAVIVVPVILGYSAFAYWIFRGRTPEEGWGE
ncbi:MAG: cytochrome d ubiquinol oxidase subunit II [Acidobacteriaceae bacterium]|nr:cytochrome d ubiquinol oxidase subunit II [Acidobacteriaceae bacterium]